MTHLFSGWLKLGLKWAYNEQGFKNPKSPFPNWWTNGVKPSVQ